MIHGTYNLHHEPWPCSVLPRNLSGEPLQAEEKLNMSKFQSLIRCKGVKVNQTNISLKLTDLEAVFYLLWDRHHLGIWKHSAINLLNKNASSYCICHGPQSRALLASFHSLKHKSLKKIIKEKNIDIVALHITNTHPAITSPLVNRPGVAGVVLQTLL